MSHRTHHLPKTNNLNKLIRELRYHEASRQILAIVLVVIFSVFGKPQSLLLYYAGAFLAVAGVMIRLWASGHVKKNKVLATNGPYAFVRHPLYVGNIALLAGFAVACGLWWSAPLLIAFLLFYYPTAIAYEDRKLHRLFGEQWQVWSSKTRALLPRLRPYEPSASSQWSLTQSLKQNGEPLIVLFLLYWLYHLFVKLV